MPLQDVTNSIVFLGGYVKRLSSTLGLNNTPTSLDVEIVTGFANIAEDAANNAYAFNQAGATPGNISGLSWGRFNFVGVIQSWTENFGPDGRTFNVKLADPRLVFDNVHVIMGPGVISTGNYKNILDAFAYYGSPSGLGYNENGTLFRNIRDYLSSTGNNLIYIYDKPFRLIFGTGFANGTGLVNPNGITSWYRIKSDNISLNQLLSQVSTDHGMDYYAYIDTDSYVPSTGVISTIKIESIKRTNASGMNDIQNFIDAAQVSGTMISYQRGRELRSDPNNVVIAGPKLSAWFSPNSAGAPPRITSYWGRAYDGSAVFDFTSAGQISGRVLLDYLTGSGVSSTLSNASFRVPYTKYTILKTYNPDIYPPTIQITSSAAQTTGYLASESVLRAALYNQDSWEAMLYEKQQSLATLLGISYPKFRNSTNFSQLISNSGHLIEAINLALFNPQALFDRDPYQQSLIDAVYEATRSVADSYYGRQYICDLTQNARFQSNWLNGNQISYDNNFPVIEYRTIPAAWSESSVGGVPSGVSNHVLLNQLDSPIFKDDVGRLKSFISYNTYTIGTSFFPYPIDTSLLVPEEYFIEQGNKLCVPISTEQYDKYPTFVIVSINSDIQGRRQGAATGYPEQIAFVEFLEAMGYTKAQMDAFNLIKNLGENFDFGLAPAKPICVESAADNYGVFFPLEFNIRNFGPWISSTGRAGPVNLINDSDLAPWTFGSYSGMESAGNQTANKSLATSTIIDSAELVIAGLPDYNIGSSIGNNANITSISLQYGVDGLTTAYGIRTFALPIVRVTKLLTDKISQVYNKILGSQRLIKNIDEAIRLDQDQNINNVGNILKSFGYKMKPSSTNNNKGTAPAWAHIWGSVPRSYLEASGI
jgi:hypothetical protein